MISRWKNRLIGVAAAFALVLCVATGIILFGAAGGSYARVSFKKNYYFLVRDCEETTAAAVSGDVYSAGGAGYYLQENNAVAVACYFKEASAESVRKDLQEKGTDTRVLARSPDDLVLRGRKSAYKSGIESNLQTVDALAHLLYETANGLEQSELTQKEAKAALGGVVSSLNGLISGNEGDFYAPWNVALKEAGRRGAELASGLLFSKDLRYLQTQLCDNTVNLNKYFA